MAAPDAEKAFYDFGPFRIDAADRTLLRAGQSVPLQPKTFDLLLSLVENAGQTVGKEELLRRVWPDAVVEEANLTQNVYLLRKVLSSGADAPKYIETISKRGYKFAAAVEVTTASAVVGGGAARANGGQGTAPAHGEIALPKRGRERRFPRAAALLVTAICCAAVGALLLISRGGSREAAQPAAAATTAPPEKAVTALAPVRLGKLTDLGRVSSPAISPDGKYLAYNLRDRGQQTLWLKNLPTGSATQIGPPTEDGYGNLVFSRDGNHLYYVSSKLWPGEIRRLSVLGGAPRAVTGAGVVWSAFALSPDDRQLAFVRREGETGASALIVVNLDGEPEARRVAVRRESESFALKDSAPAWSPDGRRIACAAHDADGRAFVIDVDIAGGVQRIVGPQDWKSISNLIWLPDNSGLMIVAVEKASDVRQIYHLSYPDGATRRVTNDLNNYYRLSLTADAQTLVTEQIDEATGLWVMPAEDHEAARQIAFRNSRREGLSGACWTADNRLVYTSEGGGGRRDLWISDADGGNESPLTSDAGTINEEPITAPDGRRIAFVSDRAGRRNIWTMRTDGTDAAQLTFGQGEENPTYTPDGRWVIYTAVGNGPPSIWKVAAEGGGDPSRLIAAGRKATVSPDGKLLTYNFWDQEQRLKTAVAAFPDNGGEEEPLRILPAQRRGLYRWSSDGKSLIYISEIDFNLWLMPIREGERKARPLTRLSPGNLRWFDWSRDGKWVVMARSVAVSDAVSITNFR